MIAAKWCSLQISGLLSLHNHMSQFLVVHIYRILYTYICPIGSISLKNLDLYKFIQCLPDPDIKLLALALAGALLNSEL